MNILNSYSHTIQNMYNRYLHDILQSIFIKYLQYLYQYSETTNVNNDPPVDFSSGSCSDFRSLKDDIYICMPILVSYCSTLPLNLYLEKVRTVGLANNNSQPSFSFTPADHLTTCRRRREKLALRLHLPSSDIRGPCLCRTYRRLETCWHTAKCSK